MSAGFAHAVAEGLRHNGVTVSFEPGWEVRGNGQSFPGGQPEGLIVHHTGTSLGGGLSTLVQGRSDLSPPLCNCCIYPDGRVHIIAAHPANHAGASGGRSMGPLPTTTLFNRRTWGVEIMYPGVTPWTPQQYRSALVLGGVISGILHRPGPEWVRGHGECSITGKWDPGAGRGPGIPFDMARFRREIPGALRATDQPAVRTAARDADRSTRRLQEIPMWLTRTPRPDKYTHGDHPDRSYLAIEDIITLPGPAGGWSGRTLVHLTAGFGGAWIQEAWWGRSGTHIVRANTGLYVPAFETQGWEAPKNDRTIVIRYAAPNGGSVAIETER